MSLTVAPAGPETVIRGQPEKFCPRSTTWTPGSSRVIFAGLNVCMTLIGRVCAGSTPPGPSTSAAGCQSASSKPG